MLKNTRIVYSSLLAHNKIYFGIIKVDFTSVAGKYMEMARDKNMAKAFNFALENISIRDHLKLAKDKDTEK